MINIIEQFDFFGELNQYKTYAPFTLRLFLGLIFAAHGYQKLFMTGVPNVAGFFGGIGIPAPLLMAWIVSIVEFAGGLLIIAGLFTRIVALLLAIILTVAIIQVKWAQGLLGGYELDLALMGMALSLMLTGAGTWSLDRVIGWR